MAGLLLGDSIQKSTNMKRLAIIFSVLFLSVFTLWQSKNKKKDARNKNKHEGEIDEEMRGPSGEEMYIGSGGGRYFIRNNKKIYVGYKRRQSH